MCSKNQLIMFFRNDHGQRIPAPTRSLKSSHVGADMTLTGRPFHRRTVDRNKDPCMHLVSWKTRTAHTLSRVDWI